MYIQTGGEQLVDSSQDRVSCVVFSVCNVTGLWTGDVWWLLCRYSAEEIHFNLMAIVSDRLQQYQKSVEEIHKQIEVRSVCSFT